MQKNDPELARIRELTSYRMSIWGLRFIFGAVPLALMLVVTALADLLKGILFAMVVLMFGSVVVGLILVYSSLIPLTRRTGPYVGVSRGSSGFKPGSAGRLLRSVVADAFHCKEG